MGENRKGGRRKMKRKIIGIFIGMLFIASILFPISTAIELGRIGLPPGTLDQKQDDYGGWVAGCWNDNMFAQSFIPTLEVISGIELNLLRKGNPVQLKVSIRINLSGRDLTSIQLPADELLEDQRIWQEFDFPDIGVIPGETYYIVWDPVGEFEHDNTFYWSYAWENPYEQGCAWFFKDSNNNWSIYDNDERPGIDFCFRTYGYDNDPPNKPSKPSGKMNGKIGKEYIYTTSTTDPDGDDVFYLFDWGNGMTSFILGPYESGAECNTSGIWFEEGSYEIKVRSIDEYGAESEWSDPLSITMPKNKPINSPFLNFLENHPHMFPLLRQLLKL